MESTEISCPPVVFCPQFDSGVTKMNQSHGWQANGKHGFMATEIGERSTKTYVKFTKPFSNIPKVVVSFNTIDASDSVRVKVDPTDITNKGFNVVFTTWASTKV